MATKFLLLALFCALVLTDSNSMGLGVEKCGSTFSKKKVWRHYLGSGLGGKGVGLGHKAGGVGFGGAGRFAGGEGGANGGGKGFDGGNGGGSEGAGEGANHGGDQEGGRKVSGGGVGDRV